MAFPASELVRVQPRVLAGTGQDLAFNGLFLDTNGINPANSLLTFRDASSVSDYFGASSAEYRAARVYFNCASQGLRIAPAFGLTAIFVK